MTRVAVVGLGAMGGRIARRLLEASHEVIAWNRDSAKARLLTDFGAISARSPAEAARKAEVVVIMVSDPQALQEVTEGTLGVAAGATDFTTVIQMSTVGPDNISRLASVLPAGAGLLDAPVLGSLSQVETGTLTVFVGGSSSLIERWRPLLSVLGSVVPVGPLGAGTAAKLVANATLLGVLCVLGEALALAEGLGLSWTAAFEVLGVTPLAAQAERRRPGIADGQYPARFALSLAYKDADLILSAAVKSGTDLRLSAAARRWFADAEEAGLGHLDYSAVLSQILRPTQW